MLILIRIPLYLVLRKCHLSFLLYRVDNDSAKAGAFPLRRGFEQWPALLACS